MLTDVDSPEFARLFTGFDLYSKFTSLGPSYNHLQQVMADPSIDPANLGIDENGLNFQGVSDLQFGTRKMAQKILLPGDPDGSYGFLKKSIPALEQVMKFEPLDELMPDAGVYQALGVAAESGSAGAAVKTVAYAAGMSALSSMGPVGAAAAAIVGFALAIRKALMSRKNKQEAEARAQRVEAYKSFPPLMEPVPEVDTWSVNNQLLPLLQSGDWTKIFSPRFKGAWVGIPRDGGYALAPGDTVDGEDPFGNPLTVFSPSGGLGYMPGQNRITSVIQVELDPLSLAVERFRAGHGKPPMNQQVVRDVGDYLTNTTRLAAIAWEWATNHDNSTHLYKLDVPTLHNEWRGYCESGLDALRSRKDDRGTERDFYLSAISCAIGAWQCNFREGFHRHINANIFGRDMWRPGPGIFHPNRDPNLGCTMRPGEARKLSYGKKYCLGTIYEGQTKLYLDRVAERQRYYLRHSLACAYVRRSWGGFRNNKPLETLLDQMRVALLDHPDRKFVELTDVPPNETVDGKNLRQELIKRGVGKRPELLALKTSPGRIVPTDKPAPGVGGGDQAMPFDIGSLRIPVADDPWWKGWRGVSAGASAAALGWWLWPRLRR